MKYLFLLLIFCAQFVSAQKMKKDEKETLNNLTNHISFLSSDLLQGRRAGSEGERAAAIYIINEFQKTGLTSILSNNEYRQHFDIDEGKEMGANSHLIINENELTLNSDFFSLPFSGVGYTEAATALMLKEKGGPWFLNVAELLEKNKNNPHYNLTDDLKSKAEEATKMGATALFIYNTGAIDDNLKFEPKAKDTPLNIPVVYLSKSVAQKYLMDETMLLDIKLKIVLNAKKRIANNIIGYINNNAPNTIVIGAHYDHLGYGEDHNSLYSGTEASIHNGADDNASGVGAMIELAKALKNLKLKNNNFVFIAFSGEELGLFGSKYFTENSPIDLSTVNYMINLDMIGRLNDSTMGLTIGGVGTSPAWGGLLTQKKNCFNIKTDSSGVGPSDHTSFYRKNIPVLFFFTGIHSDYHKPSDDADKINYTGELKIVQYILNIVKQSDDKEKLTFTKTKESTITGKSSFKVTLGIMPDYTFTGNGVRADGISEGKIAQRIGMKAGDILIQLGDFPFVDVQGYMEVLSKFKKGDSTKVKVMRGGETIYFDVTF